MLKNKKTIFFIIIAIAIFFRFYNLSSVPPSASLDEASIGYNAYSIIKTGADEYGNKFPMLLRAYDDWRPALYVYLVIPFVKIFGLNVLSVRLPSIILSILTVVATYFLMIELFKNHGKTRNESRKNAEKIALLASFLLAISPWHIYISRLGHEANAGLAFFVFAFLFFLKRRIYVSFFFFALSFASYQSEKLFIPLFLIALFFLFRKELLTIKKKVVFASIISLIILVPFIKESLSPNALIRAQGTSIFNVNQDLFYKEAVLYNGASKTNDLVGKVIHNRRVVGLKLVANGYISHFNPAWLFTNPSADPHKIPNLGLLYPWELPLIILGVIFLLKLDLDKRIKVLILLWILISPLTPAFTTDAPHAMRSYTFLPSFQILSALGFIFLFNLIGKKKIKRIMIGFFLLVVLTSLIYLYNQYFIVFPRTQSVSFQYALSKVIPKVLENEKSYNKIVFSNKDNLYQSYMFFLFYSKYDPFLYQMQGGTKSGGFAQTHQIGKFEFRSIDLLKEKEKGLYIGNKSDFPGFVKEQDNFSNLDGNEVISMVEKR
ncbi:MAG: glycosyltransferase family 39 protein [Candidatus Levybacteria bacterium]|nr:glycosyltransferase family 39 protein [Candidatus Levybacteria bacterium]